MPRDEQWQFTAEERRALLPLPERLWDKPVAAPSVALCEGELVCLSFSSAWSPFIAGAIGALLDSRHWVGDDTEQHRIRQQIERLLEQMQYGCSEVGGSITYGDALTYVDEIVAGYDGTPGSIHPLAPADTFDSDATDTPTEAACRSNSLCKAAEIVVQTACAQELTRRNSAGSWVAWSGFLTSSVIGGFGIGGPLGAAIAGLSAVLLAGIVNAFTQLSDAVLSDACAQKDVACCLASNLSGLDVTFGNFRGGLDNCCSLTGNGLQICGAIAYLLNDFNLYLLFQRLLGLAQADCLYGSEQGCGCDKWCALLDFRDSNHGFVAHNAIGGNWVEGTGWVYECGNLLGQPHWCQVDIDKNVNLGTIRYVSVEFDYSDGGSQGTPPPAFEVILDNTDFILTHQFGTLREGRNVLEWFGSNNVSTFFRIRAMSRYDNAAPFTDGGSVIIRSVKLAGCGISNPLFDCDNCSPPKFDCP